MNPSATSTPQIKEVLDWAFANREKNDRAREITERYKSGKFNYELKQAGMEPVDVPVPKKRFSDTQISDIKSFMQQGKPDVAQMTYNPNSTQKAFLDMPSDLKETAQGIGKEIKEGFENAKEARQQVADGEITRIAGAIKAGGGTASAIVGTVEEAVKGFLKLPFSQENEDKIASKVAEIAKAGSTAIAAKIKADVEGLKTGNFTEQDVYRRINTTIDKYKTDPSFKAYVDGFGGFAELATAGFGLRAGKPVVEGVEQGIKTGFDTAKPVFERASIAALAGAREAGATTEQVTKSIVSHLPSVKQMTPNTGKLAEPIIANVNRMTPAQRIDFTLMTKSADNPSGMVPEQWLRERGIVGSRNYTLEQLGNNFVSLRKNVDDALDQIPGTYKTQSEREDWLRLMAEEAAKYSDATLDPQAQKLASYLDKAKTTGLTTTEINDLKRYFEKNVRLGYMKDPTATAVTTARATEIDNGVREFLIKTADQNGFPELREINKEIQQTKFLADNIAGRQIGEGANNNISLTDWIVLSPTIAGNPGYIAGFVGKKLMSTDAVRGFAARALAGFPEVKPIPAASMDKIQKAALEKAKKEAATAAETEAQRNMFMMAQDANMVVGAGDNAFLTQMPVSRAEEKIFEAASTELQRQQIVKSILEARQRGEVIMLNENGTGFVMKEIDTMPEYGWQGSADIEPSMVKPLNENPEHLLPPSQKREPPIEF